MVLSSHHHELDLGAGFWVMRRHGLRASTASPPARPLPPADSWIDVFQINCSHDCLDHIFWLDVT
jgi:hypothetical protein